LEFFKRKEFLQIERWIVSIDRILHISAGSLDPEDLTATAQVICDLAFARCVSATIDDKALVSTDSLRAGYEFL
jgi:hypothetical protein